MNDKKKLILLLAVFALIIGGAYVLYTWLGQTVAPDQLAAETTEPLTEQELETPDFTVYDAEGREVRLSDYFGKPIVLNFWASWCGPCKMEMPDFQEKYLELEGEVHFLMVNMTDGARETVETATAFLAESGFTFPVFFDSAYEASAIFGVYSLPTTLFIDKTGIPIAQATGAIDAATLQKGIDMIYMP